MRNLKCDVRQKSQTSQRASKDYLRNNQGAARPPAVPEHLWFGGAKATRSESPSVSHWQYPLSCGDAGDIGEKQD